jgi:ATP-dependent Clp protease ATP-binding subunit ClpC
MDREKMYTAKADRVLFFARYEASRFGNDQVEPEHVLLGLARADPELFRKLGGISEEPADYLRAALTTGAVFKKPKSDTFGNLRPLSGSAKTTFDLAVAHSERLNHEYVATEHILLGLLAQTSRASQLLRELGFTTEDTIPRIANGSITDQYRQSSDRAVLEGRIVPSD